jgi:hypothetical protein
MKTSLLIFLVLLVHSAVAQRKRTPGKRANEPERLQALAFLRSADTMQQSIHWPHVTPGAFLQNVRRNIEEPFKMNNGRNTNFCAYGAVSYTCLKNEPLRYAECMVELYRKGAARFRNIELRPSDSIRYAAGQIIYQGELDVNPADQMWLLCLAHRFKGYLNFFNRRYDRGDENTMWASTNLAKFNRMLRRLCKYKVGSRGSDILRPASKNIALFIKEKLEQGEVYLYLNNAVLRKKTHTRIRKRIPTHFVVLLEIDYREDGNSTVKYWDGGYKTVKEVSLGSLKNIIYGVSWVKYKERSDE